MTDTDIIAREVVEPGTEGLLAVVNRFGPGILKADGGLDRAKLAAVVFEKESLRQDLETLLHPRIRAAWQARLEAWRNEGCERAVVVIPLLFETGAEKLVDRTICVACTAATQMERLRERGWSDAHVGARIGSQWPIEKKMERSDYVVWSEGAEEITRKQIDRVVG